MARRDESGAAFPTVNCDESSLNQGGSYTDQPGMSVRDYFAAKAMQGWLASWTTGMPWKEETAAAIAARSYEVADAMLEERARDDEALTPSEDEP